MSYHRPPPLVIDDDDDLLMNISELYRVLDFDQLMQQIVRNCTQFEVEGQFAQIYYRFLFPPILLLCTCGSTANMILYWHRFLRGSPTVRLLMAKAASNLLFCFWLIPNFVYFCHRYGQPIGFPPRQDDSISSFYWHSLKYVLFAANVFNIVSIWLTVAVTAEHYVLVSFPVRSRKWSTIRNAQITILVLFPLAIALQSFYLTTRVTRTRRCPVDDTYIYYGFIQSSREMFKYEQIYFFLHSTLILFLPMSLLVAFSIGIWVKLFYKRTFHTNTEQKQTVTRLALATTLCHLVFEMPQLVVNVCAIIYGGDFKMLKPVSESANFLSIINASIPFVVYMTCSKRFRQLFFLVLCGRCCSVPEEDLLLLRGEREHKKMMEMNKINQQRTTTIPPNGVEAKEAERPLLVHNNQQIMTQQNIEDENEEDEEEVE